MQEQNITNNKSLLDMATMSKIVEPFRGEEGDDADKWTKDFETKVAMCKMEESDKRTLVFLLLKGKANDWWHDCQEELSAMPVHKILSHIRVRFTTALSTEKILESFLDKNQVKTTKEYMDLLEEASILQQRGSIGAEGIIKLIIKKVPAKFQAILYMMAETSKDWQNFKARASNASWLNIDELAEINAIAAKEEKRPYIKQKGRQAIDSKFYCKLHGNNKTHNTQDCWALKKAKEINMAEEMEQAIDINKVSKFYSSISKNPFYKNMCVGENKDTWHKALIDTGADVSIINRRNLPKNVETKATEVKLKAATGEKFTLREQAIGIKAQIGECNFKFNPLITELQPAHTIVGADTIQRFPEILNEV